MEAYKEWGKEKLIIDRIEPGHYVRNFLILNMIKKFSKKFNIKLVCEIGCGVGVNSLSLGKLGFKVYAADSDPHAIQLAENCNKHKNVEFECKDLLKIEDSGKYDLVLAVEVLEHIKEDLYAINKMKRLLKKNGLFLLTVPINEKYRTDFDERSGHFRRYSKEELIDKLKKNGFSILKTRYFNYPLLKFYYFHFYLPMSRKKTKRIRKLPFWYPIVNLFNKVFLFDLLFNSEKAINLMILAKRD